MSRVLRTAWLRRVAVLLVTSVAGASGTLAAAPPAQAATTNRTVRVTVYDASGVTVLHQYTANAVTENLYRFSVAAAGWNDPGSGEGQVSIDDLVIDRVDGTQTTMPFTTPPTIVESTSGGTADALRHDLIGGRMLGVSDSGRSCTTNYESIDVGGSAPSSVSKARFTISRVTGDTGDGSWWELYAGLTPSDSEPILNAKCTGLTGTVDNLLGVHIGGDGDNLRREVRGSVDGSESTTPYTTSAGTTYLVEIVLTTAAATVPTAPQSLSASAGPAPGQIRLAWTPPASNGNSALTGYRVYRSTSSTTGFAQVATTTATTTSYVDSGRTPGTTYYYKVRAVNAVGEGPDSPLASSVTYAQSSPPRSLDALPGSGQISLTWQAPADTGGATVTGYKVYRSSTAGGPYSLVATLGATASYTNSGLGNGATRYYRVRAVTAVGDSTDSNEASATSYDPPYDCGAGGAICTASPNQPPATPGVPDGPAGGTPAQTLSYAVSGTDPDEEPVGDDVISYTVDWGDGRQTSTGYVVSGTTVTVSRAWPTAGTYCVKARSSDNRGGTSAWSGCRNVTLNNAPNTPGTPSGPTAVTPRVSYVYTATATDPDGHAVHYVFNWGDGTSTMTDSVASGTAASASHWWSSAGSYCVRVHAIDSGGLSSGTSGCLTVNANTVPNAPAVPSGPTSGVHGTAYSYATSASDPDGDDVQYTFDWGDGTTSTTPFTWSGYSHGWSHTWSAAGSYCVRARATDSRGGTGAWSGCKTVTMATPNQPPTTPTTPSGPVSGLMNTSYTYSTSSTDAEGSTITYLVEWGDGSPYSTVGPLASGATASASHAWTYAGTFCVRAYARDSAGAMSNASPCLSVTITDSNQPPATPAVPSGPTSGWTGSTYAYSTAATDPEGTALTYTFDWGDGATSTTGSVASGATASRSHAWSAPGSYCVRAYATDSGGRSSGWSGCKTVTISNGSAPNTPSTPTGSTALRPAVTASYSTAATDVDGHSVYYTFDWGDGTTSTTGWVASGAAASAPHYWSATGSYCVRAYATDTVGLSSGWSPCRTVTVSQNDCALGGDAGNTHAAASSVAATSTPCGGALVPGGGDTADWYRFSVNSGSTITVTLAPGQDPCVDYDLFLWNPSGVEKAASTAGSCSSDAITFTADVTGSWRVEVRAYWQITGTYTVTYGAANGTPTANFTYTRSGMTVTVTSTSTDPEGNPLTYTWNWGDGSPLLTTTATSASHTYANRSVATFLDVYSIRLTASDGTTTSSPRLVQVGDIGPSDAALAQAWAPVFWQDTFSSSDGRQDYFRDFKFDGNVLGYDNWGNALGFSMSAYVYYYVVETETNYHIGYMVFHPRDWWSGNCSPDCFSHENDMEGALVLVQKDASTYGKFLAVSTMAHNYFHVYKDSLSQPSSQVSPEPGHSISGGVTWSPTLPDGRAHVELGVEAGGHGIYNKTHSHIWDIGRQDFRGGDGIVYLPKGSAGTPSGNNSRDVSYELVTINELWDLRHNPGTYASYGAFIGDCDGVPTCLSANAAHAPWAMDMSEWYRSIDDGPTYVGDWFEDPANFFDVYLTGLGSFSHTYTYRSAGHASTVHDYENNRVLDWTWRSPGASRVRVHFTEIDIENLRDYVDVLDPSGNVVWSVTACAMGPRCGTASGYSSWVTGDTLTIRFRSDGSGTDWGMNADFLDATYT